MKRVVLLLSLALIGNLFAQTFTFTKAVPVYKSVQIERVVSREVPYKECWEEEVPEDEYGGETVGALIGGAAGGIIGHQVGKGSGKTAATVGGAIIGTLVGKSLAQNHAPGYKVVKRCRTRYKESEERIIEYKNIARVLGKRIVKYSDRPLRYIQVQVTLEY